MSISTWLFRFIGFLVMLVGVTTLNSLNVFASINVVTQPVESAKVIEVELNDDYFKPNVITTPIEELILKFFSKIILLV